jgi:hypothetical protein
MSVFLSSSSPDAAVPANDPHSSKTSVAKDGSGKFRGNFPKPDQITSFSGGRIREIDPNGVNGSRKDKELLGGRSLELDAVVKIDHSCC